MKRIALLFFDLSLIACATIIAMLLRDNCEFSEPHFRALLPYLFVTLISGAIVFSTSGTSWSVWRTSSLNDYVQLSISSAITVVVAVGISFHISRLDGVARAVPVLQAMSMVLLLVGARLFTRIRHHRRFRPSQLVNKPASSNRTNVLLFGTTRLAELYLRSVQEFARDNISVAGVISRTEAKVGRRFLGSQVLGTPGDLMNVIGDLSSKLFGSLRVHRIDRAIYGVSCGRPAPTRPSFAVPGPTSAAPSACSLPAAHRSFSIGSCWRG